MKLKNFVHNTKAQLTKWESRAHTAKRPDQKVRDSSIIPSKRHSDQLLDKMIAYGQPTTRKQLTKITHFESNQVTAHVKTLIDEGKILESTKKAPCPITGNRVYWLKVSAPSIQTKLDI